ncbi:MAG: tripartite tricarboxylate transporter substrate binding protein [Betaproteobacteria bacterium]|nr:tripartite tricarboxylate transporter substrate binding protein [Betaproteobacteria bacterium]
MTYRIARQVIIALWVATGIGAAGAQTYPSKPIRLVIPFAPGGTFDLVGRVISPSLSEKLGQQVVVDNRPGGGTILATEIVAKANPDGYTLLLGSNVLATNPSLRKDLPYNSAKDLAPIALLATQAFAIVASVNFPASSVQDLISVAKSRPGEIAFASAGVGSTGHIAAELFMAMAKVKLIHVGYKSGGQSVTAVLGNQIPLVFTGLPNVYTHMKAGRLKILGVTDQQRSSIAPEIPAVSETVAGYEFSNWFGVLAPSGTPAKIRALLESELLNVIKVAEVQKTLLNRGFGVMALSAPNFASLIHSDTVKYGKVIKEAKLELTF